MRTLLILGAVSAYIASPFVPLMAANGGADALTSEVSRNVPERVSVLWSLVEAQTDEAKKNLLERAVFAAKKGEVRLCAEQELYLNAGKKLGYDRGDLIALCTGAVTGEAERCAQIQDSSLETMCSSALQYSPHL